MTVKHIAIIMDGNGRWATQRKRPRTFGHQAGIKPVRSSVKYALEQGIPHLTLFAFSSENWSRPKKEVQRLMDLFMRSLHKETAELTAQGVKLNFIGDLSRLSEKLQAKIQKTADEKPRPHKLTLNIAVNYGGRWDILQAAEKCCQKIKQHPEHNLFEPAWLTDNLCLANQPDPDILIRTGGEHRISNFLLWQLAYTEIFFEETLWPDFDHHQLNAIIQRYQQRERRFGKTSEQLNA